MKLLIYFLLIFSFRTAVADEFKSLSCSSTGSRIVFVNGVWNELNDPKDSAEEVNRLIKIDKKRYDAKGVISVDYVYNFSEGYYLDVLQVAAQKAKELGVDVESALRNFFYKKEKLCEASPVLCRKIDSEAFKMAEQTVYHSEKTVSELVSKITSGFFGDKKVILVSHSQGNFYANDAYHRLFRYYPTEAKKYYANLQVAPPTFSAKSEKSKYILSNLDVVINLLREVSLPFTVKSSNFTVTFPLPTGLNDFHRFTDYYLSSNLIFSGNKQGSLKPVIRTAQDVFLDTLEELAWQLDNNDPNCCDGEDGRLYRADYDSEPQGFVASSVNTAEKVDLQISDDSQICGKVEIENFGNERSEIHINNASRIDGVEQINIKGDLYLDHSYITNRADFLSLDLINGSKKFPLYFENSYVDGPTKFIGPIMFTDAYVEDVNEISGYGFTPPDSEIMYTPHIKNAAIFNGTVIDGFYYIERPMEASVVQGKTKIKSDGSWSSTFINSHPFRLTNVSVIDHVGVSGQIDPDTYLKGSLIEGNTNGVIIDSGSRVYSGSSLFGSIVMASSLFRGYWSGGLNSDGFSASLTNGSILNPPAEYNPEPSYSKVVIGAPIISGAQIYNTNISGTPTILGGNLNSCNVTCDAKIYGETKTGFSFGCGYQTGQTIEVEVSTHIERHEEIFEELKLKNEEKIREVLEKLEALRS